MKINDKHLANFASSGKVVDMEGWLWKKGELNTSYQKRWCILAGNLFFYFEKKADKEPIGVIILENSSVQLTEGGDSPFTFSIQFTGEGSRVYKLSADDEKSCMDWITALKNCSYRYLAILVEGLDRDAKLLQAAKNLKGQEIHESSSNPANSMQLSLPKAEISGEILEPNMPSNLMKSNSLNNIVGKNLDNYNKLEDDFLDFEVFSAKEKRSKQLLSRAKSSDTLSDLSKTPPKSPKIKKNTKKSENKKKFSPQVSKKNKDLNSIKTERDDLVHTSKSAPILRIGLIDFPTLHQIYRKDIEAFINKTT